MSRKEVNFKSKLIEWSQKYKFAISFERIKQVEDKDHSPKLHTEVKVEGLSAGKGTGCSKKESQQNAARMALNKIKGDADFRQRIAEAKEANDASETISAEADPHPTALDD